MLAFVVEAEAYAAEWRALRPVEKRSAPVAPLPWTQEPGPRPAEVAGRPRERHIDPNGSLPTVFLAEARQDPNAHRVRRGRAPEHFRGSVKPIPGPPRSRLVMFP